MTKALTIIAVLITIGVGYMFYKNTTQSVAIKLGERLDQEFVE